jgi:malectin (di-glucose binding ER protein)
MSSTTSAVKPEAAREELERTLSSSDFSRARSLSNLLRYLCEKQLSGESDQLKEYTIAVEAYGRPVDFRQKENSIVRVEIKRLRERLRQYYENEGAEHPVRITIPVGQYIPVFSLREEPVRSAPVLAIEEEPSSAASMEVKAPSVALKSAPAVGTRQRWIWLPIGLGALLLVGAPWKLFHLWPFKPKPGDGRSTVVRPEANAVVSTQANAGSDVGSETVGIRILAGAPTSKYVDHAGRIWAGDRFFTGGSPFRTYGPIIYRTLDPELYQTGRQGDFNYDIPLKPGVYELRLHFAETVYGPDEQQGGGETSRLFAVMANEEPLMRPLDIYSEADGNNIAEIKVFKDVKPAADGVLHLRFYSWAHGKSLVNAIEVLPAQPGAIRPIRFTTHDRPVFTSDGREWAPDGYFKGGRILPRTGNLNGTSDPVLFQSERFGHFSYAIPVAPGHYSVTLHFAERFFGSPNSARPGLSSRVFDVTCNGQALLRNFDIFKEAGGVDRALTRKFTGMMPNSQGKLLIEFKPVVNYALINAIEVIDEAWKGPNIRGDK